MKIKLIFILLLLSAFNVFGDDNKKLSNDEIKKLPPSKSINLEEKDVLTVCKGDDVTKWNNCWGKIGVITWVATALAQVYCNIDKKLA